MYAHTVHCQRLPKTSTSFGQQMAVNVKLVRKHRIALSACVRFWLREQACLIRLVKNVNSTTSSFRSQLLRGVTHILLGSQPKII